MGLGEADKFDHGTGTPLLGGKAEGAPVPSQEEITERGPHQCLQVPIWGGAVPRGWSQDFLGDAKHKKQ